MWVWGRPHRDPQLVSNDRLRAAASQKPKHLRLARRERMGAGNRPHPLVKVKRRRTCARLSLLARRRIGGVTRIGIASHAKQLVYGALGKHPEEADDQHEQADGDNGDYLRDAGGVVEHDLCNEQARDVADLLACDEEAKRPVGIERIRTDRLGHEHPRQDVKELATHARDDKGHSPKGLGREKVQHEPDGGDREDEPEQCRRGQRT